MIRVIQGSQVPNCWQCRYFAISYEARWPYLCRLMGIKTRALPGLEVLRADGRPCQGFVDKGSPAMGPVRSQREGGGFTA
jgi:hypothetical protein